MPKMIHDSDSYIVGVKIIPASSGIEITDKAEINRLLGRGWRFADPQPVEVVKEIPFEERRLAIHEAEDEAAVEEEKNLRLADPLAAVIADVEQKIAASEESVAKAAEPPKRGRGRPRKYHPDQGKGANRGTVASAKSVQSRGTDPTSWPERERK